MDPNALNNVTQLSLDIVRDSDADGVPTITRPVVDPGITARTSRTPARAIRWDGVGDACDSQPYHDDFISNCIGFGPAPITLSDTDGAYMSVNCSVTNDSDNGNTLPGHADTVTLTSSVTGFPSSCDATPTFPNSGVQTTLVSPGSATFVLLDDETRPVLLRIRFECHTATPNIYPVLVSITVDHQNTGGGDEAPAQQANNTGTVPKNVILVASGEPTANPQTVTTNQNTATLITLTGADFQDCELTFATGPATNGLLALTNNACTPGNPDTDSASVTFTPTSGACSPTQGSFTFTVNDGSTTSAPATVTVTISCPPAADPKAVTTPEDIPIVVTLTGSDVETCQLTFATGPATNGSLGTITDNPCTPGNPNTDSATVTFTPAANVVAPLKAPSLTQ
jgi:hypothetical protein